MLLRTRFFFHLNFRQIHQLINTKLYPIHDRHGLDYQTLVLNSQKQFETTGCLYLPNFLPKEIVSNILNEINQILTQLSKQLFQSTVQHKENLYEISKNNQTENEISSKTLIAYDQIPKESLLRKIYSSEYLIDFLRDIIQIYPKLYQSRDPLGALYVNIYCQMDQLDWHKDHSHFFVNLLFQQPTNSHEGIFQYKINENCSIISRNDFQAGGLVLFHGRLYSHRITKVSTSIHPRINAILTYDCHSEHYLSDYVSQKFFGRTSKN